ncbi:MAG TPA: branched-chain amino acid ABC transporter permease [Nocardioides sp.]|uniref:branched-chain amino acid ABC transporter permease n=1 Tax=Nocardioides sp. TaxID=35761 RepID=UPI002D7EB6A6|nr:branched-chain amino acid ABC transporter permease [Nocardioides sp.]HET6652527.1 branched-chain amino acid ABC transporter permease [Nocardioides sp.]
MSLGYLSTQVLNGLSFGALLFLLASGFTLVFGLMRVVNLAHGAFYLLGGNVAISVTAATGSYLAGLVTAVVVTALVGLVSERLLLRPVRNNELLEVLVTVGLAFVIADLCLWAFGGNPRSVPLPEFLTGSVSLGSVTFPKYRLVLVILAVAIAVGLKLIQSRTRIGTVVRAGVDDRETASSLGIDIERVFTLLFVFGAALAGLAGVAAAGILTMRPGADTEILLFALVVVIIGGLGSIEGAALGSVLIGLIDAFSRLWLPELSYFAVFAPMALILVLRPQGLLGKAV